MTRLFWKEPCTGKISIAISHSLSLLAAGPNTGEMSELAEGARLEIACTANSGTEGSNPSLSAIITHLVKWLNG